MFEDHLFQSGKISWQLLLYGFEHDIIDRKQLSELATKWVVEDVLGKEQSIICAAEYYESEVVYSTLKALTAQENQEASVSEIWRYVLLKSLIYSCIPNQEKIDRLQQLYSQFDYPADMENCSIYSASKHCPIEAAQDLITKMEKQQLNDHR
ncbi:DUF2247 family protein (plasmid) [Microbulbifer sp. MKSA007]|nr:DUF2247 family protein [Microbulbifer sp. MKSA007]